MKMYTLKNPEGRLLLWSIGGTINTVWSRCDRWKGRKRAEKLGYTVVPISIKEIKEKP